MTRNQDAIDRLCRACGLCCNGVLFGDVELKRGDDSQRLAELGLELFRKGSKSAFHQPCACFDGTLCRIYRDRPKQCRAFACGLLKRVTAGKLSPGAALKRIAAARRNADAVFKLVRDLGNTDETKPLSQRYADVAAQPMDMTSEDAELERHGELMMAVARLMEELERDFRT